jgi:hypothetical protein
MELEDWMRPYSDTDDGYGERTLGCHVGNTEALNVRNPQPGMHYYHAPAAKRGTLRGLINKGYEVVPPESPELVGESRDPRFGGALDSSQAFGDVILTRIPIEKYRQFVKEEQVAAQYPLSSNNDPFLNGGSDVESRYSRPGYPTRYRLPAHRGTWIGDETE